MPAEEEADDLESGAGKDTSGDGGSKNDCDPKGSVVVVPKNKGATSSVTSALTAEHQAINKANTITLYVQDNKEAAGLRARRRLCDHESKGDWAR